MNWVLTGMEIGVSYAFPQAAAAIQGYHYAKTTYLVAKAGVAYFSGDVAGGTVELARVAASTGCESQREICVNACMKSGMWSGIGEVGACLAGCDLAYRACLAMG